MFVDIKLLTILLTVGGLPLMVIGQLPGTLTPEEHPPITWQKCAKDGTCTTVHGAVNTDEADRHAHNGEGKTCVTGSKFDPTICADPVACGKNCQIEGNTVAQYKTNYGVSTNGGQLSQVNSGSRLYFMANETNYEMFQLLGGEITFDVDMSKLACGLNGALYLVSMESDGGASKHPNNKAGAKYGTGYCDAQCQGGYHFIDGAANPDPKHGACCSEMDLWEANSMATVYTPHPCEPIGYYSCFGDTCKNHCDSAGCGYNSYTQGNHSFYGPGLIVDTNKVMTVVTQFITSDGTPAGHLTEIRRYYVQGGKVIPNSMSTTGHVNSLTEPFCASSTTHGGLKQMGEALRAGMVLVASLWEDTEGATGGMTWLDAGVNGPCPSNFSRVPQLKHSSIVYSNIKYGPINSTFHA